MDRADILLEFDRCGIQPTPQRIEIAGILLERPQHLSAEQIIDRLRAGGSGVSKATVYNTLKLFVEKGFIHELRLGDEGSIRYDINTEPHHHLLDKESGRVLDLPFDSVQISNLEDLEREYSLERISVTIEGKIPHHS